MSRHARPCAGSRIRKRAPPRGESPTSIWPPWARTALCVSAERAVSRALTGSCSVPLGAYAEMIGERLHVRAFVGAPDGSRLVDAAIEGPPEQAVALGETLAAELRSRGADEILAALEHDGGR